jgi:hypothetical protein
MAMAATRRSRSLAGASRAPLRQPQTPPPAPAAAPPTTTTTTAASATAGDENEGEETACPICFDTLVRGGRGGRLLRSSWAVERFWLDCGHAFCKPCLSQYAATSVQEGKTAAAVATTKGKGGPLVCPVQHCKVQITETTLKQLLSAEVRLN